MGSRHLRWGLAALVVLAAGACSGGDDAASSTSTDSASTTTSSTTTTTAPERPASTTTTAYDPAAVEGQVEAAYLRSWDVYADAVYALELDEAALSEVYAGEGLANVVAEIEGRIADGRAALVRVDHDYEVVLASDTAASVIDRLVNHQVLIDPVTKEAVEPDPNETQILNFVFEKIGDRWCVTLVQRVG